jgi:antitoxin component of RelBE/YafQ-DinJ toxin-antitoxin module
VFKPDFRRKIMRKKIMTENLSLRVDQQTKQQLKLLCKKMGVKKQSEVVRRLINQSANNLLQESN